jgi:heme/copper-type cytochrome/quinol oxidase subunit 3
VIAKVAKSPKFAAIHTFMIVFASGAATIAASNARRGDARESMNNG